MQYLNPFIVLMFVCAILCYSTMKLEAQAKLFIFPQVSTYLSAYRYPFFKLQIFDFLPKTYYVKLRRMYNLNMSYPQNYSLYI